MSSAIWGRKRPLPAAGLLLALLLLAAGCGSDTGEPVATGISVPTATKIVPCADRRDVVLKFREEGGPITAQDSVSDVVGPSLGKQWFWLDNVTGPVSLGKEVFTPTNGSVRFGEFIVTLSSVDGAQEWERRLEMWPLSSFAAVGTPGALADGDRVLVRVVDFDLSAEDTGDFVRLSEAFLVRGDGSVATISPCAVREEDEPNLGGWLDDWLAEVAGSRGQTPAALLLELVADPSLMASLPDRSKVPPSPSTTVKPTSTTAPRPPLPPGSQLVQLDVTVPESWADDESDAAFGVCPRTETGTGMCVLLGPGNGAQFPLRIFTAPGLPIEIVVTDGMRDQDVVAVAGSVVAPADASGRLAVTLTGEPSAPKIAP